MSRLNRPAPATAKRAAESTRRAAAILQSHGINAEEHVARVLDPDALAGVDLLLAMDQDHLPALAKVLPTDATGSRPELRMMRSFDTALASARSEGPGHLRSVVRRLGGLPPLLANGQRRNPGSARLRARPHHAPTWQLAPYWSLASMDDPAPGRARLPRSWPPHCAATARWRSSTSRTSTPDGTAWPPAPLPMSNEVLTPLSRGEAAAWNTWDWAAGAPGPRAALAPAPVIIIEGVGAGCAAARAAARCADLGPGPRCHAQGPAPWPATARSSPRTGMPGPPRKRHTSGADAVPAACRCHRGEPGRRQRAGPCAARAGGPAGLPPGAGARTRRVRGTPAGAPGAGRPPRTPQHSSPHCTRMPNTQCCSNPPTSALRTRGNATATPSLPRRPPIPAPDMNSGPGPDTCARALPPHASPAGSSTGSRAPGMPEASGRRHGGCRSSRLAGLPGLRTQAGNRRQRHPAELASPGLPADAALIRPSQAVVIDHHTATVHLLASPATDAQGFFDRVRDQLLPDAADAAARARGPGARPGIRRARRHAPATWPRSVPPRNRSARATATRSA